MAIEYTEKQLNHFDKTTIVQLFLAQQSQLKDIDHKLQFVLEQVAVLNNHWFGKSSEKLDTDNQISFLEVEGQMVFFNEAEAIASLTGYEEEELIAEFGEDGWYQLGDEIFSRYKFTPAKVEIEEHHVGVYKSIKENHFKKAEHPGYLSRNSLVSASLEATIINAKYLNAIPLYRQEQEFERYGVNITRGEMAHWTILCTERYLAILYDYLHGKIYDYHVLRADETPVRVTKENRTEGDKHYMWVYRTGNMYQDHQIVLYEYQPSKNASQPREFLRKF